MLDKLLRTRKPEPHLTQNPTVPDPLTDHPGALKIVHVGGVEERYYMAVPAKWIIDKYPRFHLTRPEFFRQPWQSLVGPDQILLPGQRFFVVPRNTVRKLRRRFKTPLTIAPELVTNGPIDSGREKHVGLLGRETEPNRGPLSVEKKVNGAKFGGQLGRGLTWEPSLASIAEKHGPNE